MLVQLPSEEQSPGIVSWMPLEAAAGSALLLSVLSIHLALQRKGEKEKKEKKAATPSLLSPPCRNYSPHHHGQSKSGQGGKRSPAEFIGAMLFIFIYCYE